MSDYIKQLEDQNEELRQKLAEAEAEVQSLRFKIRMDQIDSLSGAHNV